MATKLRIGKSTHGDAGVAAGEAAAEALAGTTDAMFALVLATDQYDHDALARAVSRELGGIPWAGCCTAGVFSGTTMMTQGLVIGVIASRELRVSVGVGRSVSTAGQLAGRTAVEQACAALPIHPADARRALIVLPDSLTGSTGDVVRGAAAEAGSGLLWAGGGAGDNLRFVRTAQYAGGEALHDSVVVIMIDSVRPMSSGIRHGWRAYGPPTTVTRAVGARVFELDYEPAFEVYRRTAAQRGDIVTPESFAEFSSTHPLGIPQADGEHVIRDPLAVEADGTLRLIAAVPEGSIIRMMQGDRDLLLTAALAAASDARAGIRGDLGGAIVFDCVSRSLVLKESIGAELAAFEQGIGRGVPMMGCLTFGEIGALGAGIPQFHNKTAVLLALPA